MSASWSLVVALVVLANILGCIWLIYATAKRRKDEPGEKDTTGHVWDGDLVELNNPMPAWWLFLFIFTIVFGLVYVAMYPGLGNFPGLFNWSETSQHQADLNREEFKFKEKFKAFEGLDIPALARNEEARNIGRSIFLTRCVSCHGSDARGAPGYPNLTDKDWLYGGAGDQIVASITSGRKAAMPAWGAALGDQGVQDVVAYLRGRGRASTPQEQSGQQKFQTFCVACHGPDGKGNQAVGAPNLMDDIWLYGGTPDIIATSIRNGRSGQMPAHEKILSPEKIRLVAGYVYSLSQE